MAERDEGRRPPTMVARTVPTIAAPVRCGVVPAPGR